MGLAPRGPFTEARCGDRIVRDARITGSRVAAVCALLGAGLMVMASLAAPAVAAGRSVAVKYYAFSPSTITVRVGDTITWTNVDTTFEHDVTFASFGSGTLSPGASYKHTFGKIGTFGYLCSIHGNKAKVVVTGLTTPQPTRRPTPKPTRAPTPRPTPSPSPTLSPSASASPNASATPSATQTPTPTTSSAIALSSTSTASTPAGQATPAADVNAPTVVLILVVALAVAGAVGLGALAARRR
jgi:plastocyanin